MIYTYKYSSDVAPTNMYYLSDPEPSQKPSLWHWKLQPDQKYNTPLAATSVSQMESIWQLKGVNMCLDSEGPPDNAYNMLAWVS